MHSAGLITNSITKEQFIVVTGGGGYNTDYFESTEILEKDGTEWKIGKLLLL